MSRVVEARSGEWLEATYALQQQVAPRQPKTMAFSFRVRRLLRVLLPLAEDLEESRRELIDKYSQRDEDGNPVSVGEDGVKLTDARAFQNELKALMGQVVALSVEPLTSDDLDAQGIVLSPAAAYALGPLLVEGEMTGDGVREAARRDDAQG